jgi:putative cell wall-binding protein
MHPNESDMCNGETQRKVRKHLKGELQSPTQNFSQQIHSFTTSKKKENPSKRALHLLLKILTKKKNHQFAISKKT